MLQRTDSQKERANQAINRFGDPNMKAKGNESDEEMFQQVDPILDFHNCVKEILYEEFKQINKNTTMIMMEDSDEESKEENNEDIVTFVFEEFGKCIKAHKHVLISKLSLFGSMLGGGMKEGQTNRIDVEDTEYEPYYALIEYLYTGEIKSLNSKYLIDLFELADRF
mmetsp:Transcript_2990/g.3657  ORF Transcript_2990/g.3657 Transcript_2990/m.3657 type:complete len:167 (+) Transcript_2990:368-868(+)